jgi:CBS domain-containing protein
MIEDPKSTLRSELEHARVGDCMHAGIFSCAADTPARELAAIMTYHHVHAMVVNDDNGTRPLGIASDLDVVQAAAAAVEPTARQLAATEPLALSADEPLRRAAQVMSEHGVTHVVVRDATSGYPVGVLSSLDIAAVYARRREAEPRP